MPPRRFIARRSEESLGSIYLSISDLMSGLLMIFVLLVMSLLSNLKNQNANRIAIIQSLKETFMTEGIKAEPDKDGDISVLGDFAFEEASAALTDEGKLFLDQFIPVYSDVIFSKPEYKLEIVKVVVEGHTSMKGSDDDNMTLSLARADEVYRYISSDMEFAHQADFNQKVLISGRGEIDAVQEYDREDDRTVMFRLQFRGIDVDAFFDGDRIRREESATP